VAPLRPGSSPGCSTGEFRVPSSPAFTDPGSLLDDGQRVLLPRHRVAGEYTSPRGSGGFDAISHKVGLNPRRSPESATPEA
jgi:hypothetical protein